jgi:hydroxypyruvate isomerase
MLKFSANLSMLYSELPFIDRVAAAAGDGFAGVEYLGAYDLPADTVAKALRKAGVEQVLFNLPSGDWAGGERGIAALPGREDEFRAGVAEAIRCAHATGCARLNCLAGIPKGGDRAEAEEVLVGNLHYAAQVLASEGMTLMLEPVNDRDVPGFLVTRADQALALIDRAGAPNLRLQWDFYHMQIMQGDLCPTFERLMPRIGHVQIADHPGRGEPGTGEINYRFVFEAIERAGWDGWIGCEYKPVAGTREGLSWRDVLAGEREAKP